MVIEFNHDLTAYILYLLMTLVVPAPLFSYYLQVVGDRAPCLFAGLEAVALQQVIARLAWSLNSTHDLTAYILYLAVVGTLVVPAPLFSGIIGGRFIHNDFLISLCLVAGLEAVVVAK